MDTRKKIVDLGELRRRVNNKPIRWVRGYFDPLLAEHARRLGQLRSPGSCLAVVIRSSNRPLLAARARAELVAALSAVDFVILDAGDTASEDLNDMEITEEFSGHVRRRHSEDEA